MQRRLTGRCSGGLRFAAVSLLGMMFLTPAATDGSSSKDAAEVAIAAAQRSFAGRPGIKVRNRNFSVRIADA